jgi:hypothetical protein
VVVADWRAVQHLYEQFSALVSVKAGLPTEVVGSLANQLSRVLAFYEDHEDRFVHDLLRIWSTVDNVSGSNEQVFRQLYFDVRLDGYPDYRYPPDEGHRRRPRPFEACVETCRRLVDVNNVRHQLWKIETGAVLGGSVSYGRFYNVKGAASEFGSSSSDSDLLVVLKDHEQLARAVELLSSVPGVDAQSLNEIRNRASSFSSLQKRYDHCIFSHKLKFWVSRPDPILDGFDIPAGYTMSLHVFSLEEFDYMTLRDIAVLEPDSASGTFDRVLHDYRDSRPPSKHYDNQSFSGIPLPTNSISPVEVPGGFVTTVQVCTIRENRYCPGLHQNLVLPQFEKRWESETVRLYLRLLTFRWKIMERLRTERTARPFEEQKLSLSHVRYFVFSPHITRRADRD